MGCRTGFYLLVRDVEPQVVLSEIKKALLEISENATVMFGAERKECGNYRELSLEAAKVEARAYLAVLNSKTNDFKYPTE
jgi:S-ribosylhomocysteine lyase